MSSSKAISHREKTLLESAIQVLVESLHPGKIILFGSRSKGTAAHGSDFDLAVDCAKPSLEKERRMEKKIEEMAGLYKVDIVYLASVDEDFKKVVRQTGKVVYERS